MSGERATRLGVVVGQAHPTDGAQASRVTYGLGVVPLMVATGAGAASQQSIGTVVFGGMLASTLLAIPFVPVFYVLLENIHERRKSRKAAQPAKAPQPATGG